MFLCLTELFLIRPSQVVLCNLKSIPFKSLCLSFRLSKTKFVGTRPPWDRNHKICNSLLLLLLRFRRNLSFPEKILTKSQVNVAKDTRLMFIKIDWRWM